MVWLGVEGSAGAGVNRPLGRTATTLSLTFSLAPPCQVDLRDEDIQSIINTLMFDGRIEDVSGAWAHGVWVREAHASFL